MKAQFEDLRDEAVELVSSESSRVDEIDPDVLVNFQEALRLPVKVKNEDDDEVPYPPQIERLLEVGEAAYADAYTEIIAGGQIFIPALIQLAHDSESESGSAHAIAILRTLQDRYPEELAMLAPWLDQADGNWQLESIRETTVPRPAGGAEQLGQLAWMVGTWIDRDGETLIETTCQWTTNRNFLTRSFSVVSYNQVVMSGTQVIGWDAATEQLRSWLFDSEGGVAEATWPREGDRWFIKIK